MEDVSRAGQDDSLSLGLDALEQQLVTHCASPMTTHRSTPSTTHLYGLYDPNGEGVTFHESREDRDVYAKEVIKEYLSEGEWNEEVTQVFAFVVTDRATAVNIIERKGKIDDDGYDENDEYWPSHDADYKCDYELKPFPAKTES